MLLRSKRKLGWHPNPGDSRDFGFEKLGVGGSTVVSEPIQLTRWLSPVRDQNGFNSCVGEAPAAAIEIVERQAGLSSQPVSSAAIYGIARHLHTDVDEKLRDTGTYPRLAAKAVKAFGVVPASEWPRDKRHIGKRVPFRIAAKAHGRRGASYVFLQSTHDALLDEIVRCLRAGYPVAYGSRVTKAYTKDDGPIVVGRPNSDEPIAGGHYQLIVGVRMRNGRFEFRVLNSWGTDWRDGGFVWIDQDYITWFGARDFMVLYGWEAVRNARPDISL